MFSIVHGFDVSTVNIVATKSKLANEALDTLELLNRDTSHDLPIRSLRVDLDHLDWLVGWHIPAASQVPE